ncbi:MAG TPA: polysaccharide deacetylase family protein [Bryobacteraceae bacterium]
MRTGTVAGFTAGAVLGGVSATAAYGSVSKSSQLFGPSVYCGPGRRRSVALTFDDGPSEGTMAVLEYLDREGIKGTFFQCGANVRRLPQVAGAVSAAGHQIGNHTYSHPHLMLKSRQFIDREFTEAQRIIQLETGVVPMLLRPPYGFRWVGMRQVQERLSLLGVLWTVIGHDWHWGGEHVADYVLRQCSPGGIICLHDGRSVYPRPDVRPTLTALRRIVPELLDRGYTFDTVSEILHY